MAEFGSMPISISILDGSYTVAPGDVGVAEAAGITDVFDADRLPIMQARGMAHGYILVVQEDIPVVEVTTKKGAKS